MGSNLHPSPRFIPLSLSKVFPLNSQNPRIPEIPRTRVRCPSLLDPCPFEKMSFDQCLYFDGSSLGNPGSGGCGYYITDARTGAEVLKAGCAVTINGRPVTNNEAEYFGLIEGLTKCLNMGLKSILVRGDSTLVIKQMIGDYEIRSANLRPLHIKALELAHKFPVIAFESVPRAQNKVADSIARMYSAPSAAVQVLAPVHQPPAHQAVKEEGAGRRRRAGRGGEGGGGQEGEPFEAAPGRRDRRRGNQPPQQDAGAPAPGAPGAPGAAGPGVPGSRRARNRGGRGGRGRGGGGGGGDDDNSAAPGPVFYGKAWLDALEQVNRTGAPSQEVFPLNERMLQMLSVELSEAQRKLPPTFHPPVEATAGPTSAAPGAGAGGTFAMGNMFAALDEDEDEDDAAQPQVVIPEGMSTESGLPHSQLRYLQARAVCGLAEAHMLVAIDIGKDKDWPAFADRWQATYDTVNSLFTDGHEYGHWYAEYAHEDHPDNAVLEDEHVFIALHILFNAIDIARDHMERNKVESRKKLSKEHEKIMRKLNPLRADRDEVKEKLGTDFWENNPTPKMTYAERMIMLHEQAKALEHAMEVLDSLYLVDYR